MAMDDSNTLSDNVFFEHVMPVRVSVITPPPGASQFVCMNEHNEKGLSQVLALDSFAIELTEDDSDTSAEMSRIERKLDLLMEMVSILFARQDNRPDKKKVTLYSSHIDWVQSEPLVEGCYIELKIWLRPDYPKALQLYVRLQKSLAIEEGYLLTGVYCGLNEMVITQLEKIIFRHHRRVVAQSRHE
ncbi:hypothetical protein MNBD_GAMMA12-3049 [hydrothermal vent metagenome]|uniref:Cyclic di-GMP receptor atypical PilZ domain-containing protein n=1 Tax=hydrothermal vent metagenome TaxID=652676 RepID=A0A3B0YT93_9ZZZZ